MKKFTEICEINLSKTAGVYLTYKFVKLLKTPFNKWDAYELGLINEKGEKIKDPKTAEEKTAFGTVINLVRKIKRMFGKYIPNEKLLSFLVSIYLMKETPENKTYRDLSTKLSNYLNPEENDILFNLLKDTTKESSKII